MTTEFIQKIIRCFAVLLLFLCIWNIAGLEERIAQQYFLQLGIMVIFGLLLRNIWVALFLWWSVFLFCFYKFNLGNQYLGNIFLGCILYYFIKISCKKEHITFFINAVLWLCAINIFYGAIQASGFEFIYKGMGISSYGLERINPNYEPVGFMGFKAGLGMLIALCVPLLASRDTLLAKIACLGLFIPLYVARASSCVVGAVIGLLFVLWYRLKRIHWILLTTGLILGAFLYVVKVDMPMNMMPTRLSQWKMTLEDCIIHPITGWGLDSFRNITEQKKHLYIIDPVKNEDGNLAGWTTWDNPHNLYVSLFFEWGIFGLIILGGYLRQCGIWFINSIKAPHTLALAGFVIVVLIISIAQFPLWLARLAFLIITMASLYEIQVKS